MPLVSKNFSDIITFTRASSATFTGSNGLIQSATTNTPRFDYDPVTLAAKGLLIEEQRTNLLTYSEQFNNAPWLKTRATITANSTVAPDGTSTASTFEGTGVTGSNNLQQAATAGGACVCSVYAKANTNNFIQIAFAGDNTSYVNFDVSTGAVGTSAGTATGSIVSAGSGWYRCIVVNTSTAVTTIVIALAVSSSQTRLPSGNVLSTSVYLWGAQLEAGSFATSYIPTVASQVTRSADVASVNTLSPWYNATEGTLYVESGPTLDTIYPTGAVLTDGTTSNNILIQATSPATSQQFYIVSGGVAQVNLATQTFSSTLTKTAAAYKANDFAYSTQGAAVSTDVAGSIPTVSQLVIGAERTSNLFNGTIRRITYYPRRLTNAELQAITA